MTTEENDQLEETAVPPAAETPPPPLEPARLSPDREGRSELIKFGLLVLVFVVVIAGVALARPFIFDRLIPAIMGGDQAATPAPTPTPAGEITPEAGNDVFLPALTTDPPGGSEDTAVEATAIPATETAVPEPLTHIVQPGETLTRIARQYNVSLEALMAANNLVNANYIQVGQSLVIPQNPAE